jgi:hypothetical protein
MSTVLDKWHAVAGASGSSVYSLHSLQREDFLPSEDFVQMDGRFDIDFW